MDAGNLLADAVAQCAGQERFDELWRTRAFHLERIVSTGQATPPGTWYDQTSDEWVLVVQGRATLRLENEPDPRILGPGDYLLIPARVRHRVEWTQADPPTVWLALFHPPPGGLSLGAGARNG